MQVGPPPLDRCHSSQFECLNPPGTTNSGGTGNAKLPFKPMVDNQMWITVSVKLVAQAGLQQYLANVPYESKLSMSKFLFDS